MQSRPEYMNTTAEQMMNKMLTYDYSVQSEYKSLPHVIASKNHLARLRIPRAPYSTHIADTFIRLASNMMTVSHV